MLSDFGAFSGDLEDSRWYGETLFLQVARLRSSLAPCFTALGCRTVCDTSGPENERGHALDYMWNEALRSNPRQAF